MKKVDEFQILVNELREQLEEKQQESTPVKSEKLLKMSDLDTDPSDQFIFSRNSNLSKFETDIKKPLATQRFDGARSSMDFNALKEQERRQIIEKMHAGLKTPTYKMNREKSLSGDAKAYAIRSTHSKNSSIIMK